MEKTLVGQVAVGGTTYQVYKLSDGVATGYRNWALEGPTGATYFVTDHGPQYKLNSVATGGSTKAWKNWTPSPRPLRGLTRQTFAAFLAA